MNSPVVLHWAPLVARALLGAIFIISGFQKLTGFSGAAGYIASVGLPMPEILAVIAILIELGAGTMLLVGFWGRIAAKALFIFTALATIFFHMNFADPMQAVMILKNLAIMGGLLMVFVHGTGPMSLKHEEIPGINHGQ